MRLKYILKNTLFGMVLVSAMPMQAQQIYTLQSCLEEGLQNNYSIQIVRNDEQITHNNATIANAGYLPTLDLSAGYSGSINSTETTSRSTGEKNSDNGEIGRASCRERV